MWLTENLDYHAFVSVLCTCVGTGILQLPLTLEQGGWSCLLLILVVAVCTHTTGLWLIRCLYSGQDTSMNSQRRLKNYPAVGEEAYGKLGKWIVHIFHKATLLGVTSIFLVLASKFMLEGIGGNGEGFVPSLGSESDAVKWQKIWAVVASVIVWIPLVFVKTMKEITPLAIVGLLASSLCVIEIVVFAFIIQPVTEKAASEYDLPVPESFLNDTSIQNGGAVSYTLFTPENFPLAFAAIGMSFSGHSVFPDIEKSMENRAQFRKTFTFAYVIMLTCYLLAAGFGFYTFGNITYSPILCNFPRSTDTTMGVLTASTKLLIAFHVLSTYPILMTVLTSEIEENLGLIVSHEASEGERTLLDEGEVIDTKTSQNTWKSFFLRSLLRTCLVGLTSSIAIFLPFFPLLMELVGAVCLPMMVFILPCVFSWKLWGHEMTLLQKVYAIFIIALGSIAGFIGGVQAVQDIIESLRAGKTE